MRLTKTTVAGLSLPTGKSEIIVFDDAIPGFGVRMRAGGSRAWVFQYKTGAKHRRLTLGRVSALDPARARQQASELHAKVRLGQDPAGVKAETQSRAGETLGACVRTFLAWQRPRVRVSTYRDTERHLLKNLAGLHGLRIDQVDRRAIAAQLARMADRPTQANRTRASLSKFLNWAAGEGLVETNAALLTNKHSEASRDRVLSAAELRAIWLALPEGDYGDILKLLALTGQRAREISDLHWDEIDLERSVIDLPPQRTKNHRRHLVPMSPAVRAILKARVQNGRAFVFGAGKGGFSGWSKAKKRLDDAIQIKPWRVHDLRRTCATGMAEIGIAPHVIEATLNHVSGHKAGVSGIYNRAAYEPEKATALLRWADRVAAIVEGRGSKVTPIKRA